MYRSPKSISISAFVVCSLLQLASFGGSSSLALAESDDFHSIGRVATPKELADWDSNIRDDFQGLKPGRGSVTEGKALYEAQCLSCHGASGNEVIVFSPLVGGFTKKDVETGVVKAFEPPISIAPSTLMRVPTLATIMDYIGRAMPWDNPKSLTTDEVYALTAYILHLGELVESDFVLSDKNVQAAQSKLPNRNAFRSDHGLWPGESEAVGGMGNGLQPDIKPTRCMNGCNSEDSH